VRVPDPHRTGREPLVGRSTELDRLVTVLDGARQGTSGVVVLHGEAGIGKSALLGALEAAATDFRVLWVIGVQAEAGLGFAGLHRLLAPLASRVEGLPAPQRQALETAFGLRAGATGGPDRFLVGLALLTLLDDVAADGPVLCVVDDAQWLDRESLDAIAFVARRLAAESVALVLAYRSPSDPPVTLPEGLPTLAVEPLGTDDALELLHTVARGPVDRDVALEVLARTAGSPLAIIELTDGLTAEQLLGGGVLPEVLPIGERLESHFLAQVRALPEDAQTLLLLAALDGTGDPVVVGRAASDLGLPTESLLAAESSTLVTFGPEISFRHPLARAAVLAGAPPAEQRRAHQALAVATDDDRWRPHNVRHRAAAATGPDEAVADALLAQAELARERGGVAAEAALRTRAAELTADDGLRAGRRLAAAQAHLLAGNPQQATALLEAVHLPDDDVVLGVQATRLRAALLAFTTPGRVPALLSGAADRAVPADPALARLVYAEAIQAAMVSCQLTEGVDVGDLARRALEVDPGPDDDEVACLLRTGFARRLHEGYAAAAPVLDRALDRALALDRSQLGELEHWTVLLNNLAAELWDLDRSLLLAERMERAERRRGALEGLRITLGVLGHLQMWRGRFSSSEALHSEASAIAVALGSDRTRWEILKVELLAWRGDDETTRLMSGLLLGEMTTAIGAGVALNIGRSALMILDLGQGRYAEALEVGRQAMADDVPPYGNHCLADVVEAAMRSGQPAAAREALDRLEERAAVSPTPWSLGLLNRSRALVADDGSAEEHHRAGIVCLEQSGVRTELARSHLVYGEWLRRERRRTDARDQLRSAHGLFVEMGAGAFAERARVELAATGERARRRVASTANDLTPQELQIATLASEGQTNREIAAVLFISPSTVDYHLRKVFRKLGIEGRRQLARTLPGS
jgi:DNA-binding CsgD family transcriptional regulator